MAFIRFQLERWIQRGVLHQVLLVAGIIGLISVAGGLLAWLATSAFANPLDAIWWSFLRLTDPGYLGDDEGVVLRTISTVVTVLGYVLFMGSLIAIMTQWLAQTIDRFDRGMGRIVMEGHVVVIGWTNRTPEIVRELVLARGRLRRFLQRRDQRKLRIVVIAREMDGRRRRRLQAFLGPHYRHRQIFLRSGSEISRAEMSRFDLPRAGAIIVPGDEFRHRDLDSADANMVKMLVGLRAMMEEIPDAERPPVVAEMFDPRKVRAARGVLRNTCTIIPGDAMIAMLLVQGVRDPRLIPVFLEFLSHARGCAPYVKAFPDLVGANPAALNRAFERAIVVGTFRPDGGAGVTRLGPAPEVDLEAGDQLILLARSSADLEPVEGTRVCDELGMATGRPSDPVRRRVLVLGSGNKLSCMIEGLSRTDDLRVEMTVVARTSVEEQEAALEGFHWDEERVVLSRHQDDFTVSGVLEELDLADFDTILLLSSISTESAGEADARTMLGYELVKAMLDGLVPPGASRPEVIVELIDPGSEDLLSRDSGTRILSPRILGHLQTHAALQGPLGSVFPALFMGEEASISIRPPQDLGLTRSASFAQVEEAALQHGAIALGVVHDPSPTGSGVELCPASDRTWSDTVGWSVVLMSARA